MYNPDKKAPSIDFRSETIVMLSWACDEARVTFEPALYGNVKMSVSILGASTSEVIDAVTAQERHRELFETYGWRTEEDRIEEEYDALAYTR